MRLSTRIKMALTTMGIFFIALLVVYLMLIAGVLMITPVMEMIEALTEALFKM